MVVQIQGEGFGDNTDERQSSKYNKPFLNVMNVTNKYFIPCYFSADTYLVKKLRETFVHIQYVAHLFGEMNRQQGRFHQNWEGFKW